MIQNIGRMRDTNNGWHDAKLSWNHNNITIIYKGYEWIYIYIDVTQCKDGMTDCKTHKLHQNTRAKNAHRGNTNAVVHVK